MLPWATCGLPQAWKEASRPATTPAVMAGANADLSAFCAWQISHAALEAPQEQTVDIPDSFAAHYVLWRDFQRHGSSSQPRCELHAASCRSQQA